MPKDKWDSNDSLKSLQKLIAPGVLGLHNSFEVTEIFGLIKGKPPVNLLTVIVAEQKSSLTDDSESYLTNSLLKIKTLKHWSFGVKRYTKSAETLIEALVTLDTSGVWKGSSKELKTGNLTAKPPEFAPSDSAQEIIINNILKNNYWNGSYFFEWADSEKNSLSEFFEAPQSLQELSEELKAALPINLAKISDRLGNIIIQLPVTAVVSSFSGPADRSEFNVDVEWLEGITPRPLRLVLYRKYDKLDAVFRSFEIKSTSTTISTPDGPGDYSAYLWDDENEVLISSTGAMNFINNIDLGIHIIESEPRTFIRHTGDDIITKKVSLITLQTSRIGNKPNPNEEWASKRMYTEEIRRLKDQRRFVQYKPLPGQETAERDRALSDVRWLINTHGKEAAWLWDPFLDMNDVLDTLFHSTFSYVDLRAISAGKEPPVCSCTTPGPDTFVQSQKLILQSANCNKRGLRFEFRARVNSSGWRFHDRFLIFPNKNHGALAWSLGTSVNSLGKQHHILQRVDDGQLIMDAFLELWHTLNKEEQLICKI
ncbi:VPA1262 family N-terminal domain-containing protein [Pseudomonas beijingensis]|uniref:VPA1262 family N-terminal domain-containing protein n=1 Tax=Pseudomonas beijingensis TaxID=2954101 RepID=UPI00273429A1|nr:VPA1262 family N-terminal domain-containing protein [Pseudomonas sp. FP830]WLI46893.1 VPA1262 family N-terminal domain-containing protein [Pseudomonas sp. FP830]